MVSSNSLSPARCKDDSVAVERGRRTGVYTYMYI